MAVKHIIWRGYGFANDGIKFIPTRGFSISTAVTIVSEGLEYTLSGNLLHYTIKSVKLGYTLTAKLLHYTMRF